MDFDGIDRYQPGDDIRRINWAATARTGCAQVYRTRAEGHRARMIVADFRPEMQFGTRDRPMAKTAALAAAHLVWEAQLAGEPVGLIVPGQFSTAPGRDRRHTMRLLDALLAGYSRTSPCETLDEDVRAAAAFLRYGDDLMLVGDPLGDAARFAAATRPLLATLHLVLALVEDPIVRTVPPNGTYPSRRGMAGICQSFRVRSRPSESTVSPRETAIAVLRDAGWQVRLAADLLPSRPEGAA